MTLTPFTFPATGETVRTITIDGEPWFVAADAVDLLGYTNGRMAIRNLPERMRNTVTIPDGNRGNPNRTIVSESGVYRLAMRSTLPSAEAFQDWLAEDVVPAIRRTGRYEVVPTLPAVPQTYAAALRAAADAEEAREVAQAELAEAQPKADSWDILASGVGDLSVADAAKILTRDPAITIGRDRLFDQMATDGWVYRARSDSRWRAYQTQVDLGRLSELPQTYTHPKTLETSVGAPQLRITLKGLHEIHRRLGGIRQLQIPSEATR